MIAKASGTGFQAGMRLSTDEHGCYRVLVFLYVPVIHGMNCEEWECSDDCLALICVSAIYYNVNIIVTNTLIHAR
jgi:hypothetical protein